MPPVATTEDNYYNTRKAFFSFDGKGDFKMMTVDAYPTKNGSCLKFLKAALAATAAVAAVMAIAPATTAQEEMEVVHVTGYRASLESALNTKRESATMVDAINAEDIAAFPDANLAESLQRLPGVSIDRDNGEGRTITVRGLSADFTRVTLNGLEALSTAGASASGDDPNRSRAFDFNTFASELFTGLKVYKSPAAETDEGSLGATVQLQTGRPFDTGDKVVLSLQNGTYEYGAGFNPRVASVVSHTFLGGRLGVLGSIAYNMRRQNTDSYQNSASVSSLLYRSSVFKTSAATERYGFADAYSTSDVSHCNVSSATGTIPLTKIAYTPYCTALQGSNSAEYSTLEGTGTTGKNGQAYATILPTSATLNHRVLYQSRIGLTGSIQWQADENTLITFDGVFSSTYQDSTNYQLSAIGLNRNNTSSNMSKLSSNLTNSKDAGYLQSAFSDAGDKCMNVTAAQAAQYGIAQVSCLSSSTSQYNADPYSYYTNNGTNLAGGAAALISFVGRPSTKLVSVHVKTPASGSTTAQMLSTGTTGSGVIDQMTLANTDLASRADQASYTTQFEQGSLEITHNFSDRFRMDASLGMSVSRNHQVGYLVEFNKMDSGTYNGTTCTNCYVYDATASDEDMPYIDYGFDVTDADNWDLVKGYSNFKHYMTNTVNKFRSLKINAAYDVNDMFTVKLGFNGRIYDFNTTKYARVYKDAYGMPSISELQGKYGSDFSVSDLGKYVSWGTGLNTPSDMSVGGWFAPDIGKFKKYIISDSADFGDIDNISNQFSTASTSVAGNTYDVHEHDKSGYAQVDFKNILILGNELRGNIGVRIATTSVDSHGHGTIGNDLYASNYYANVLPSANLVYSLTDDMLVRASLGKVIARPQLSTMAPSITSFSLSTSSCTSSSVCGAGTSSLTIGNTKLKPYSANTIDIGYEWYFDQGAVLSVSGFAKYIKDMPQQVTTSGYLSDYMSSAAEQQLYNIYSDTALGMGSLATSGENLYADVIACSYAKTAGCEFTVTTYANAKGGVLNGLEINYQQVMKFLPHPFDTLGVNFNYTLLHSKMAYIISMPTTSNPDGTTGYGPWVGASPNAFNATLFYDGKDWEDRSWSGRISFAYRSTYASSYPIASGSSNTGSNVDDSSPIMNDFVYTKSTLNVDASFTYDLSEYLQVKIDALNLTNQSSSKYAYPGSPVTTYYDSNGRQIFVGVRLKY